MIMILKEACDSLKLECALRNLGFVDIGWKVIANAGIFFVQPVGWSVNPEPKDELLGFLLEKHIMAKRPDDEANPKLLLSSAREALELAELITNASINEW